MNQSSLKPIEVGFSDGGSVKPGDLEILQLKNVFWALRRSASRLIMASAFFGVLAYLLTYTQEEKFTSVAKVMIDTRVATDTEFTPDVSGLPISLTTLESELEVLRSTDLIEHVVDRFELYNDPEFIGAEQGFPLSPTALLRRLKNIVVGAIDGGGSGSRDDDLSSEAVSREETIKAVLNARDIEQIGDASAVYAVRVSSVDPRKAAMIANALTEEYLAFHTQTKRGLLEQSQGWLTTRISQLQVELNELSSRLESHEIEQPFTVDEYATIKAERVTSTRQKNQIQVKLEALNLISETLVALEANGMVNDAIMYAQKNNLIPSRTLASENDQEKIELLTAAKNNLREDSETLGARLQDLNEEIEVLKARQTVQIQHDAVTRRIENEIAVTEVIYQDFVSQLSRRTQQDDYLDADARIIEKARPPIEPSEPRRAMSSLTSMIIFMTIGVFVVILREAFQTRLRTGFEIEEFTGVKPAGFVPEARGEPPRRTFFLKNNYLDPGLLRFGRKLWANSDLGMSNTHHGKKTEEVCKIFAGASAKPGEGQSTSLLLLGRLCAEADLRTLIIDCDHVNSPYSYLQEYTEQEIEEIEKSPLCAADYVVGTPQRGLDILPVMIVKNSDGAKDPETPIEYSPVFEKVLDSLCDIYDRILLDTPPLLSTVDAASLLRYADNVVVFTRWNHSHRGALANVLNIVEEAGTPLAAIVPTRVNLSMARKFGDPTFAFGG